jgi:hypothetical protein
MTGPWKPIVVGKRGMADDWALETSSCGKEGHGR